MPSENSIPEGTASIDFESVLRHEPIINSGSTLLPGQVGDMHYYRFDKFNLPLENLLDNENVTINFNLTNSKLYFKVLREDNRVLEVEPGFILGENITITGNSSLFPQDYPEFLTSYFVPEGLTIPSPASFSLIKNPTNETELPNFFNGPPALITPPGVTTYLDPNNWDNHQSFYDEILTDLTNDIAVSSTSYIDWYSVSQDELPNNVYMFDSYYMVADNLVTKNGEIKAPIPIGYVYYAYNSSEYNHSLSGWEQTIPNFYQYQINSSFVSVSAPEGTNLTLFYYPDSNIYAKNGVVTPYGLNYSQIYGVFDYINYDYDLNWDEQTILNYFIGGSIVNNNIVLGTPPGSEERLIIVYREFNYPIVTYYADYTPNVYFDVFLNITTITGDVSVEMSLHWDLTIPDGWLDQLFLAMIGDMNSNNTIEPWEKIEISLVHESVQTTNDFPVSVGDSGQFVINKSKLDISLSPEFETYWSALSSSNTPTISEIETNVSSLEGEVLANYSVFGFDGLFYGMNLNIFDPFTSQDDSISEELVVNGFDGGYYQNITFQDIEEEYLSSSVVGYSNDFVEYYQTYLPLPNVSVYDDRFLENITLDTDYFASTSYPIDYGWGVFYYNASEYNWTLSPYEQLATRYYDNYITDLNNVSLYSFDGFVSGSQVVLVYVPSRDSVAIDGKLLLSRNVTDAYGVYQFNTTYYLPYGPNLLTGGLINDNVLTLGTGAPMGMYRVWTNYSINTWDNYHLYVPLNPYQTFIQSGLTTLELPIPARTPDWFISKNNIDAVNLLIDDKFPDLINLFVELINNDTGDTFFNDIILNTDFNLGWIENATNFLVTQSLTFDGSFPFTASVDGIPFDFNTYLDFNGYLDTWKLFKSNGQFVEIGVKFHLTLSTTKIIPPSSEPSSLPSSESSSTPSSEPSSIPSSEPSSSVPSDSTSSTPSESSSSGITITTSPGFEIFYVILLIPMFLVISRGKKLN
ncbi:MAG: hypothetical protein HeimC3_15850 [Candidatus Heimdallarchaeota archaeon LC_3]|nr:MAG: hypothetical protein HeimC3_15850 [Candidatus Heimdallarchaeota archaeon LC_3]